jgi:hypothetical protein
MVILQGKGLKVPVWPEYKRVDFFNEGYDHHAHSAPPHSKGDGINRDVHIISYVSDSADDEAYRFMNHKNEV